MAEQDRNRWDADDIAEGVALLTEALPRGATGPYQLQAAIAADPRRGPERRGHRLAADRGPVRTAAADRGQPGGDAEPRRRGGHGAGARRPGSSLLDKHRGRRADRATTTDCPPSARTCSRWPAITRPPAANTWPRPGKPSESSNSATCIPGPRAASRGPCGDISPRSQPHRWRVRAPNPRAGANGLSESRRRRARSARSAPEVAAPATRPRTPSGRRAGEFEPATATVPRTSRSGDIVDPATPCRG